MARPDDRGHEVLRIASGAVDEPSTARSAAPAPTDKAPPADRPARRPEPPSLHPPGRLAEAARWIGGVARSVLKLVATLAIFGVAVIAGLLIWNYYVTSPWTRDGRVRVQVASVAPQVSGAIVELRIVDNQFVHKGDVLYVIDPFDFQVALASARTQRQMKAADLQVKRVQADRRQHLTDLATTPEEQQQYVGNATQASAAFDAAQQQVAQAEVNLKRTQVRSPVNGFVTNLQMRVGDYVHEGSTSLSVIDADSYWIDGYFEETKMAHVCVGERAEAQLMGYPAPIVGRVESVTRGISVSDAAASTQGLPNVDPVYTWVRLAQRVPVRIRITDVPAGVPLVSGMTTTVTIRDPAAEDRRPWWRWAEDGMRDRMEAVFDHRPLSPDCVPVDGNSRGSTATLQGDEPGRTLTPEQINPGLTPGMRASPKMP